MEQETASRQNPRRGSVFVGFLKFAIVAFLIVTPFRFFVAQPFIVSGASMEPTLDPREYLVIDELTYRFEEPARGDVVIFRYPLDPDVFFIKRIIGLPGETVQIRDGAVFVQSAGGTAIQLNEPYVPAGNNKKESSLITLADDEYFVLGDNRGASSDSRVWGPLTKELIVGRALIRLFPFNEASVLPGKYVFPLGT